MLSSMNLLPVGDGHTYIDRDKVRRGPRTRSRVL